MHSIRMDTLYVQNKEYNIIAAASTCFHSVFVHLTGHFYAKKKFVSTYLFSETGLLPAWI